MSNLDQLDSQIKKYGGATSSDKFEFGKSKATYKMRILCFPAIIATHFLGGAGGTAKICVGMDEGCPYHGDNAPRDDKGNEKSPSLKLATYIIDRQDGKVKLAELPLSIRYALQDLQNTEGFEFDDFPMPYDIQVIHDPDNKDPKSKYRVTGIPKMIPLTAEESASLDERLAAMTPEQYVDKRKGKTKSDTAFNSVGNAPETSNGFEYPTEEVNVDDIPF